MKKILVVDDEKNLVDAIQDRLKAQGYAVLTAFDGKEALQTAVKNKPDLIITDIVMPELDGFGLFKELKKNGATASIPVLVLTARGKMRDTFEMVGAASFLTKPFEGQQLLNKVEELLNVGTPSATQEAPPLKPEASRFSQGDKTAVIINFNKAVAQEMNHKLAEKKFQVISINYDNSAATFLENAQPQVIFLELALDASPSFPDMIAKIGKISEAKNKGGTRKKFRIIVYRPLGDRGSGVSLEENAQGIDNFLEACRDQGDFGYLGEFSSISFGTKLDKLLSSS